MVYDLVIVLGMLSVVFVRYWGLAWCGSFRVWFSVLWFWRCWLVAGFGFV